MPAKKKSRTASTPRTRQNPSVRRQQLCDAAARLIVQQGFLPLPIEQLAKNSGVSKALFYTYFPDQYALFNSLLERELNGLLAGGLDLASQVKDVEQAALLCGTLYFEHVARSGPLLHILMADRYMAGHVEWRLLGLRNAALLRLALLARQSFRLSKAEALASIEMMLAIPEEAGRLVFTQELSLEVGRQLCGTLISSSMRALGAPDTVLSGLVRPYDVA